MSKLRKLASFVRWRLVPVRYLTMIRDLKWRNIVRPAPMKSTVCQSIQADGFHLSAPLEQNLVEKINTLYQPRSALVQPKNTGHPFVNLFNAEDIHSENPVFRLAFSPQVLEVAADYFGNKMILDSIQVLHSFSTNGEIRESQHWHLDYGDRKSFHAIAYLNDVVDEKDGPFVFVDKSATEKIGRSFIVRRIPDSQFNKELIGGEVQQFLGPAGSMVYVDPSACYHYGSRCEESRLAIFVTFSTWCPYAQPVETITKNKVKILEAAKAVRPDLSPQFLKSLLQLG